MTFESVGAAQSLSPTGSDTPPDAEAEAAPEPPATPGRRHRRRRRALGVLVAVVALTGATCLVLTRVGTDQVLLLPGKPRPTEERIVVKGTPTYASPGELFFTTVSLRPASLWDTWVVRRLDRSTALEPKKVIYPDGDQKRAQKENQVMMDDSKTVATLVALEELGYHVESGTGAKVGDLGTDYPVAKVLRIGDVITAVDGTRVTTAGELGPPLQRHQPGDKVDLAFIRGGQSQTAEVALGASPEDPRRPLLGVVVTTADRKLDYPFEVAIDSGEVTGPSAGLAWTLAVIDLLTKGDLTGGRKVAVTGTISRDGDVGPIGGIEQKVAGVKRAGCQLFLYPVETSPAEVKVMKEVAGDDLRLAPVDDLDDALKVLGFTPPSR